MSQVRSTFVGGPRPSIFVQWDAAYAAAWDVALRSARGRSRRCCACPANTCRNAGRTSCSSKADLRLAYLAQLRREDRRPAGGAADPLPIALARATKATSWPKVTAGGASLSQADQGHTGKPAARRASTWRGEMLDACGPIGGYKFPWAWVTGRIAGSGGDWVTRRTRGRGDAATRGRGDTVTR